MSNNKESKKKDKKSTKEVKSTTDGASASSQQQKELDEQEAQRRGITYKEVRQERRQKEKGNGTTKRASEPDKLQSSEHDREIKRLRTYSTSHNADADATNHRSTTTTATATTTEQQQRLRTRSFDLKEEHNLQISNTVTSLTVDEWKQQHSITIQQHHGRSTSFGNHSNSNNSNNDVTIPIPYRTFDETPFSPKIISLFHAAKFICPTPIQAQAWPIAVQQYDMICIAKTGSGSYVYIYIY